MIRLSITDGYQYGESVSNNDIRKPSCCLTINLEELKLGDVPERLLNKDKFFKLCRSDLRGLFKGLF